MDAAVRCKLHSGLCSPRPLRPRALQRRTKLQITALVPSYSGVTNTGSLNPGSYWYPKWMQYRARSDNYTFWTKRFKTNSLEIPDNEKRWTILSTLWWVVRYWHFYMVPVWIRFFVSVLWRDMLRQAFVLHKKLILQQAKLDAYLAAKYSNGVHTTFSKVMALRRLHSKTGWLAELLYYINLCKTGRVHMVPPEGRPAPRPSLGIMF